MKQQQLNRRNGENLIVVNCYSLTTDGVWEIQQQQQLKSYILNHNKISYTKQVNFGSRFSHVSLQSRVTSVTCHFSHVSLQLRVSFRHVQGPNRRRIQHVVRWPQGGWKFAREPGVEADGVVPEDLDCIPTTRIHRHRRQVSHVCGSRVWVECVGHMCGSRVWALAYLSPKLCLISIAKNIKIDLRKSTKNNVCQIV